MLRGCFVPRVEERAGGEAEEGAGEGERGVREDEEEEADQDREQDQEEDEECAVHVRAGVLPLCSGSALVRATGSTEVLAQVTGPVLSARSEGFSEVGQLRCEVRFAAFSGVVGGGRGGGRRRRQRAGATTAASGRLHEARSEEAEEEQVLASLVRGAMQRAVCLEKFPKCAIALQLTVLRRGGAELACATAAASLALAHAGVHMTDLITSACVTVLPRRHKKTHQLALTPSASTEARGIGTLTVALGSVDRAITLWSQSGRIPADCIQPCLDAALKSALALAAALRQALLDCMDDDNDGQRSLFVP